MEITDQKIVCPNCGSDDITEFKKGKFICGKCEKTFSFEDKSEDLLNSKTDHPMNVFISYAHAQNEIVTEIRKALEDRGHVVWFDQHNIHTGQDWREQLTKGLLASKGVLSFLSREAIRDGGVCLDELRIAVCIKFSYIQTVLLHKEDDLQPIPVPLTRRQWLDMSDWEERRGKDREEYRKWLNQNIREIIRIVESDESRMIEGDIEFIRTKLNIIDASSDRQNWFMRQPFVGREQLTEQIGAWLEDPNGGHLCAVYGGPGTGKSAFAARYVFNNFRAAATLFFEHGNNYFNSADAIFRELIFQLAGRLPEYRKLLVHRLKNLKDPDKLNTREKFKSFLAGPLNYAFDGGHETLCVVVDGLDECGENEQRQAADLLKSEHFPEWLRVLVLTRPEINIESILAPNRIINMTGDPDANAEDIRKYYEERLEEQLRNRPNRETLLDTLAKRTNGVFLYAKVLSDMIREGNFSLDETDAYPADLSESFDRWFTRYFPDRDKYDRLYKLPLGIIAACGEPVPVEELETADGGFNRKSGSFYLRRKKTDQWSQNMTDRLKCCSLLLREGRDDSGKKTISFAHRYIAEWLTTVGQTYSCSPQEAFKMMERSWRKRLREKQPMTEYQALHLLEAMRQAGEPDDEIRKTADNETWGNTLSAYREEYNRTSRWNLSLIFARTDYDRCCCAFGRKDPAALTALENLAFILNKLGRYQEALEKRKEVYEGRKQIFGGEDPAVLSALGDLAVTFGKLGKHDKALEIQEMLYKARVHRFGEDDPDTRNALNNLAVTLNRLGRHDEALEKQEMLYKARRQYLGEDHPATLIVLGNLATTLDSLGRYPDALAIQEKVYDTRVRLFGEDNRGTRNALNNFAFTLGKLGRYEEAQEKQEKLYKARREILGEEHPATLLALSNLAATLRNRGEYEEAREKQEFVYKTRIRILGEKHPATLIALNNLAVTLGKLGRHQKALEMLEQCYEDRKKILGENRKRTLKTLYYIGATLLDLERVSEALEKLETCYKAQEQILGEDHPDTVKTRTLLEQIRSDSGQD